MGSERRHSPYVGLVPYREEDYDLFFGRGEDVERITANLFGPRLTLLYGQSGVGKSSLINAGVLHRVNQGKSSVGAVFRDWSQPDRLSRIVSEVERRVRRYRSPDSISGSTGRPAVTDPLDLQEQVTRLTIDVPAQVTVLLDQFEDYFLYVSENPLASDRALARALTESPPNVSFLIAIREDSLALLDRFKALVPGLFDNYLRVDPLDRAGARDAIVKPLEVFMDSAGRRYDIEDELVEAILDDLEGESVWRSDHLTSRRETGPRFEAALLQVVMDRLWEEEDSASQRTLRHITYKRLKGSRAIVSSYLDRVMAKVGPDGKRLAYRMFGELVTSSGDKVAHRINHLAARAFVEVSEARPVLQMLESGRVLRLVDAETETYEVYHDILARAVRRWRVDYEGETDPAAKARGSQRRRLKHAVDLAQGGTRDGQLQAIAALSQLGRSRVDPEIGERARVELRRIERSAAPRAIVDLGQGRHVQAAARSALDDLEVDRLSATVLETLQEIEDSASASMIGVFESEQIKNGVPIVDERVEDLIRYLSNSDPTVKSNASNALFNVYYAITGPAELLLGLENGFRELGDELFTIQEKCDSALESVDTSGIDEGDGRVEGLDDYEPDEPAVGTNPWLTVPIAFVASILCGLLVFLGVEAVLEAWVGDVGWTRVPGSTWVLGTVILLVSVFIASAAYDELTYSNTLSALGLAIGIAIVILVIFGLTWCIGNLLGLMAHVTFGFSLNWSVYLMTAGLVVVSAGLGALGAYLVEL